MQSSLYVLEGNSTKLVVPIDHTVVGHGLYNAAMRKCFLALRIGQRSLVLATDVWNSSQPMTSLDRSISLAPSSGASLKLQSTNVRATDTTILTATTKYIE